MNYSPYSEYKDSGIEWLGRCPAHWDISKIRHLAKRGYKTFVDGDWVEIPHITDSGIRLIQTGGIGVGDYRDKNPKYISEASFKELNCTEIDTGDVLICRLAHPIGRACLAPDLGVRKITSVDVCILKPSEENNPQYLVYFFSSKAYMDWLDAIGRGGTRQRISRTDLGLLHCFQPSLREQTAIANFLDRETAKIDTLIDKQEQLIKLLEEKRQAVISHAVTKGLNPDVRMKDSGVEWLGEVPEHWDTSYVKHWMRSSPCYGVLKPDKYEGADGVPIIRTMDVQRRSVHVDQLEQISPELSAEYRRTLIRQGDLILSVVGTIGRTFICSPEHEGMNLSRALARLQLRDIDTARYLQYMIDSRSFSEYVGVTCTGTAQLVLNMADVSNWAVPSPPVAEMKNVADSLDVETSKIDGVISAARRAIILSRERRTALISAAVTGKIDVRNAV